MRIRAWYNALMHRKTKRAYLFQWIIISLFLLAGTGGYFWYQSKAGVTVSSPGTSDNALTSGLVAHWTFDQSHIVWSDTTTEIKDSTAGAQHGNAVGSLSEASVVPGKQGQALKFNGTSDQIETPYNTTLTSYSFAFWFKTGDVHVDNYDTIIAKFYYDRCEIRGYAHEFLACTIDDSSNLVYSRSSVIDDTWHHGVFTVTNGSQKLYVDGILNDSRTDAFTSALDTISIGVDYDLSSASHFPGSIDDVRVYNRVLSASEVYQLYTAGTATVNAPVEDPLSQSLRGYWKLDDGSGTNATDSSGNANTLAMTGSPGWVTGNIGPSALDFSGSGQYLSVADPASGVLDFANGADFSLTGWFNRDTFTADHTIVAKKTDQATNAGYVVWIDASTDTVNFEISDGTYTYEADSTTTFTSTGWHHFTAVWDDSRGASVYIDGGLNGSTETSTSSIGDLSNANAFRIGAESDAGVPFDGKLDDIRVYGYALSADEVKKLYNTTSPAQPVDTSLVGHWTFDGPDIQGSTAIDRSSFGNNGTITGAVPVKGKLGQGMSFDGDGDYVYAGSGSSLANLSALTISFWMNLDSFGQNSQGNVINKGSDCCTPLEGFLVRVDGIYNFVVFGVDYDGATDLAMQSLDNSLTSSDFGIWNHIAVTWTGSSAATSVVIYKNGQNVTQSSGDNGIGSRRDDSGSGFHIGVDAGWPIARAFDGKLDDVRLYNRVLSATEVMNLYTLGR